MKTPIGPISAFAVLLLAACSGGGESTSIEEQGLNSTEVTQALTSTKATPTLLPASILTWPGANCSLHPVGTDQESDAIEVDADDDGVARFYALPASIGDPVTMLSLDCEDAVGKHATYPVPLLSLETFQTKAASPAAAVANVRPPLAGDPMQYSISELIQAGYGLRPDPVTSPDHYAGWLKGASKPAYPRTIKHSPGKRQFGQQGAAQNSTIWGGPILLPVFYVATSETIVVPQPMPGGNGHAGNGEGNGLFGVWGGLGGTNFFGSDPTLLQSGVALQTIGTAASYSAWIEYFAPGPGHAAITQFSVNWGDSVLAQAYACDNVGNPSPSGGFGCFFLDDYTTGATSSCVTPSGSPCSSIPAPGAFQGSTAEFILEKAGPFLPATFTWTSVDGSAYESGVNGSLIAHNFSTDAYTMDHLVGSQGQSLQTETVSSNTTVKFAYNIKGGGR